MPTPRKRLGADTDRETGDRPDTIMSPHYTPETAAYPSMDFVSTREAMRGSAPDPMGHMGREGARCPYVDRGGGDDEAWGVTPCDPNRIGDY